MADIALKDMLKKALEMEEKGYRFYTDMAKKIENDVTKKTFEFLSKNEAEHIKNIKSFYENMAAKGEFPELVLGKAGEKMEEDLDIFAKSIKELREKIKPNDADKEALEFAMDFENSGYAYYKKFLEESRDENLNKLLKFLLGEEDKHCRALMEIHAYVTDSANWYMYEEGSFPQGG
jgi:rubrerythrin